MAIRQISITTGGNIKKFQVDTTDAENTYPTDCGPGSMITIIDRVAKKIVGFKQFDGSQWNEI